MMLEGLASPRGGLSGPQNAFGVSSVEPPAKTEEQKWGILMLA